MPFYVDDFLAGTRHMKPWEKGAYFLLLMEQWITGFVLNSDSFLKQITGKSRTKLEKVVSKFYVDSDGHLRNKRMELVRADRIDYSDSQSEKGKARHVSRGLAVAEPLRSSPSPSPSPSPIVSTTHRASGFTLDECLKAAEVIGMKREMVEAFWAHYDRFDWMGSQNRKITRLHSALANWKINQSSHGKNYNAETKDTRVTTLS